jgi:hypothetical protein
MRILENGEYDFYREGDEKNIGGEEGDGELTKPGSEIDGGHYLRDCFNRTDWL